MKTLEMLKMNAGELFKGIAAIDNAVSTVKSICDKAVKTDRCEVETFLPDILNNLSNAQASYSALASILLSVDAYRLVGGNPENDEEAEYED